MNFFKTSLFITSALALGGCAVYPDSPVYNNGGYNNGYGSVYSQQPTVVYQQPAPVYVQPRPVYVAPRPIVVEREPYYRYDDRGNRYDDRYRNDNRNDNRNDRYDRDDRRPPPPQARPQPQPQPQVRPQQGYNRPKLVDEVKRVLQPDARSRNPQPVDPRAPREQPYVQPDTSKN